MYQKTSKKFNHFLGFAIFIGVSFAIMESLQIHLTNLLEKKEFSFTDECSHAFQTLQLKLINAPLLAHYDPNCWSQIQTDASDGVIAAVFS